MNNIHKTRLRPWAIFTVVGALPSIATLIGFGGSWWWAFDLFANFRVQYLLSLTILTLLLVVSKKFRFAIAYGLFALVNLTLILPYYWPFWSSETVKDNSLPVLRAISINVHKNNRRFDLVKKFVQEKSPTFLLLEEVNSTWLENLAEVSLSYPYTKHYPRDDNFGVAFYSKIPWTKCEILQLGNAGVPSVMAQFEIDGKQLTLIGTHPLPPVNSEYASMRNNQMEVLARYMQITPGAKLLIGDLNATPWSYGFQKLLDGKILRDSANGSGIQPTWPTDSPLMLIPIDHCLVSADLKVIGRHIGYNVGSDHYPLVIDFALAR
ncbi:MAG: endonuclease/exonuclease/phosphatase family protein [Acidobacteriota bacterium]